MKRLIVVIALLIVTACTRKQESETLVAPPPAPVVPETVVVPPPAPAVPDVDDIHFSIEDASNYFNIIFGNLSFRLPYGYDFFYNNAIDDFYEHVIRDNNSMGLSVMIFKINNFPDGPGFFYPSKIRELAEYIAGRRNRLSSFNRPYRLRSFNNIKAADTLNLIEYTFDDIRFTRHIIFFDDKYGYFLGIGSNDKLDKILPEKLPEYFLVDESGGYYYWSGEALEEIGYKFSNNEVLPGYLQELMEKGDIIFQTMYLN